MTLTQLKGWKDSRWRKRITEFILINIICIENRIKKNFIRVQIFLGILTLDGALEN